MKVLNINELSIVDFNIRSIVAISQKWNNACKYSFSQTPRPNNGFNLIIDGRIEYTDNKGNTVTASKGDISYLPSGKYYDISFTNDTGRHVSCILINFIITDSDGKRIILSEDILNLGCPSDVSIEKYFRTIAGTYKTSADKLKLKILFLELLQRIIPQFNMPRTEVNNMEKCAEYINKNFMNEISVKELAHKCCLSETTFRKRFKEKYKMSPIKYINHKKIELACEILLSSDIKISEIADFLNFYDTSYFHKTFTEIKGVTPAQYRHSAISSKA